MFTSICSKNDEFDESTTRILPCCDVVDFFEFPRWRTTGVCPFCLNFSETKPVKKVLKVNYIVNHNLCCYFVA